MSIISQLKKKKTLPDGIMGKGRSPRGDCDKGPVTLAEGSAYPVGTVEHPYLASIESSSGISQ